MKAAPLPLELTMEQLQGLIERTKAVLSDEEYSQLKRAVETLGYVTQLVEDRKASIDRLRRILFGATTEKTRNVFQPKPPEAGQEGGDPPENNGSKKHKPGHGRNGISSYSGAAKVRVNHGSLKTGGACPRCPNGKVYASLPPGFLVRVVGQAPLGATVWELEKLRCNLCGEVFTADEPEGVGPEKYDATSGAMIALLKYGSGMPFHRLGVLQESVEIGLAASTQWGIVKEVAALLQPALGELVRQAAQGDVIYNDDTAAKVLSLMKERAQKADPSNSQRTGVFTSGIVSTREGRQIALYFTGHKHAGENLADLLKSRAAQLGPPIQMCDALSRNPPKEFKVILANCMAHGRRRFVDVAANFPEQCLYVLETLAKVYQNDATARKEVMTPDERLAFHKEQSGPLMEGLEKWFQEQIAEHKVEPNSGLGQAIAYFQKHGEKLTRFLHVSGAPLDNNITERALKKAILHRKNALFFKTPRGAHVGDLFMSLIHTCHLCRANPFDYLTELQRRASDLALRPYEWMPWNYRETLERLRATRDDPA
jgi:transposase